MTLLAMYAQTGNGVIRNCRVQPTARSSEITAPPDALAFMVPNEAIPDR
jgi:hypothetical protein